MFVYHRVHRRALIEGLVLGLALCFANTLFIKLI